MDSLWTEYHEERLGRHVVYDIGNRGFVSYKVQGDECYIADVFVKKEHRKKSVGKNLMNLVESIAREKGAKFLCCMVIIDAKDADQACASALAYGFKLRMANANILNFWKGL